MKTMEEMVGPLGAVGRLLLALAQGSVAVRREIALRRGEKGEVNVYGEKQTEIDVWSNDHFVDVMARAAVVAKVASEEMEGVRELGRHPLAVAMDPLDGSSNIRTNNPLGSIFGVWPAERFPAEGRAMVAAAYALYGPSLTFTAALPDGVHEFIYLEERGSFLHSLGPLRIGGKSFYGLGGERPDWVPGFRRFAEVLDDRGFKHRYCGCLVADVNQVLHHGGIFAYPSLRSRPEGKLRLLYEAAPMAYIVGAAGGGATDGQRDILDIPPTGISQRCPLYIGTRPLVEEVKGYLKGP
jgi:fructose-1,6-bisphosphatase I